VNVFFRVDASQEIGTGHLARCRTLAKALIEIGARCTFILGEDSKGYAQSILDQSIARIYLEKNFCHDEIDQNYSNEHLSHGHWLSSSWKEDADRVIEVMDGNLVDWMVVDHYALDKLWEMQIKPYCKNLMVIDDIADRKHVCNLLLDQNLVDDIDTRYLGLINSECKLLLGPKYALLQSEFKYFRDTPRMRKNAINRLLIYFGGADISNLTGLAIDAFINTGRMNIAVDVVISSRSIHAERIRRQVGSFQNISIHQDLSTLAPLMSQADLAIGAAGSTSWERCCVGLPSLVVSIADNQVKIARRLHMEGAIIWLGDKEIVTVGMLHRELERLFSLGISKDWPRICGDIVDGGGVNRVVDVLMG
jgi:UDP-2,4-diacetamido-2,4,6-trideoxy-beta-L-altropyranose hydrolase